MARIKPIWLLAIPIGFYLYCHIVLPGRLLTLTSHYVLQFAFLLPAAISLGIRATGSQSRAERTFWGVLSAALAIWSLTSLLEILELALHQPAYGTVADGFWIAGYLTLFNALLGAAKKCGGWPTPNAVRAGLAWIFIAGIVIAVIVLLALPRPGSRFLFLLGLFYHLADVFTVFLGIVAMFGTAAGSLRRPLQFITTACFIFYIFNLLVILQEFTAPLYRWAGAGFAAGYSLFWIAGKNPEDENSFHKM
jgi:hypothetical protein